MGSSMYKKIKLLLAFIYLLHTSEIVVALQIVAIKQGALEIVPPSDKIVLNADSVVNDNITIKNVGSSALYNVMITTRSSQGIKILSLTPAVIGKLNQNSQVTIHETFYVTPSASGYQTITYQILAFYPDGSNITLSFKRGFIVKGPRNSKVLLSVETPILCIGRWNNITVSIDVEGPYKLSNAIVIARLHTCGNNKFNENTACVLTKPIYIGSINPHKDKRIRIHIPIYVSPSLTPSTNLSLDIIINYIEKGHIMPTLLSAHTVQPFVLLYCR